MYPWLWFWAPQFHYPFSGSVTQEIEPSWFFDAIRPEAGNGRVEKQAFDVASYGKQLGLITEVLLSIASEEPVDKKKAAESLARLKTIYRKIEQLKSDNAVQLAETTVALLDRLRKSDRTEFNRVLRLYAAQSDA